MLPAMEGSIEGPKSSTHTGAESVCKILSGRA